MKSETGEHRTRSLYAAAFLLSIGFPLHDAGVDQAGRVEFVIGGDPVALAAALHDYRRGAAVVNAQRFAAELRRLKALVHGND